MFTIKLEDCGLSSTDPHHYSAFASDLGLTCNELYKNGWPNELRIEGLVGNGQPFIPYREVMNDDELMAVDYKQGNGIIRLRIFND